MSCELMGTPACRFSESVSTLKNGLGDAAKGSSAKELREVVCQDPDETLRKQGCSTFQVHKINIRKK